MDWALEKDKWQQMVQEMGDDAAEDATALRPPVADATASVVPDALRESEQEAEEEEQEGNDNVQGAVESEDYDDDEGADEESDAGEDNADMDAAEDAEAHVDSAAPPAHKFADADAGALQRCCSIAQLIDRVERAGTTLFVRNVSIDNTESDLLGVFKRFGRVAYVKLVRTTCLFALVRRSAHADPLLYRCGTAGLLPHTKALLLFNSAPLRPPRLPSKPHL